MAETSRRIGRWLCLAALWLAAFAEFRDIRADDPPKGRAKPMFQAPKGWNMKPRSEDLLFYDAPGLKDGETCRIAVLAPMEAKSSFAEWFQLVQAPDPVVSEGKVVEGKSKGGYETMQQARVVERSAGKLHRQYYGLHVGTSYVLILYSASSEELFKKNLKEVQALVDSWDAAGTFPKGTVPGTK